MLKHKQRSTQSSMANDEPPSCTSSISESTSTYDFFAATREARAGALRAGTTVGPLSPSESSSLGAALDLATFFAGGFEPDALRAVGAGAFGTLSKKSVRELLFAAAAFFLAGCSSSLSSTLISDL
jgi:hypothetical protein